ncbi:MAG: hypothetical protein A3F46_10240 [Legionellales bacterium RIFCSPHIGHO2_12_FULL_42_9]|nr:MAG: hypothetical protein A3F46_10240 [Legionellales bacterium RIFCSPHIGHO2_12_FULL_42_9]
MGSGYYEKVMQSKRIEDIAKHIHSLQSAFYNRNWFKGTDRAWMQSQEINYPQHMTKSYILDLLQQDLYEVAQQKEQEAAAERLRQAQLAEQKRQAELQRQAQIAAQKEAERQAAIRAQQQAATRQQQEAARQAQLAEQRRQAQLAEQKRQAELQKQAKIDTQREAERQANGDVLGKAGNLRNRETIAVGSYISIRLRQLGDKFQENQLSEIQQSAILSVQTTFPAPATELDPQDQEEIWIKAYLSCLAMYSKLFQTQPVCRGNLLESHITELQQGAKLAYQAARPALQCSKLQDQLAELKRQSKLEWQKQVPIIAQREVERQAPWRAQLAEQTRQAALQKQAQIAAQQEAEHQAALQQQAQLDRERPQQAEQRILPQPAYNQARLFPQQPDNPMPANHAVAAGLARNEEELLRLFDQINM